MTAALRRRPFKLTAAMPLEHSIQADINRVMAIEIAPAGKISRDGVCWWAIDHADFAGAVPGIRQGRGIIAGIWEIFVLYRGMAHTAEVKTDVGRLSDAQMSVGAAVLAAGGKCAVVRSPEEMLAALDAWGIPRARRTHISPRVAA